MTDTEASVIAIIRSKGGAVLNRQATAIGQLDDETLLEAQARADLHFDSLDMVEHVMACEEEFSLSITDDEADLAADATVRQWAAFLDAKLAATAVLGRAVA